MTEKIKGSLFAKVFLITTVMLLCISLLVFGMLAWLMPQTYSYKLNTILDERARGFVSELEQVPFSDSGGLFDQFIADMEINSVELYDSNGDFVPLPTKEFDNEWEDNVSGKLTDERFMKMSQQYDEEQQHLKKEIEELQRQCDKENDRAFCKEQFLKAVREFMEMKTLTPTILHELVERIDVYQTQGTGKNRTQRLVNHYNFIGVLDMPEVEEYPDNVVLDSCQGVAVEYLVGKAW